MLEKQKVKLQPRGIEKNHVFRGVDKSLCKLISSFSDVIVYFDPDVDGCMAGLLVCRYCAKHGIRFNWYINDNRSHDWSLPIDKVAGRDIIAVDFIITADKIKELCDAGCNIVSMDHHLNKPEMIDYTSSKGKRGIVINNQYPFEEEDSRYLSGAGVVFESLIALDPEFDTPEHRCLVAITLLSDIRNIENELAEFYLYGLYSAKYKGYIRYLIDATMGERDYGFGLPKMDRSYVDFKFSPTINACLRFNQGDQVVNFLLGGRPIDLSYREEQKALVKNISEKLKIVELSSLRVCYFYERDFIKYGELLSNFVGLVASKYLDEVHSVICYMIAEGADGKPYVKRASFRGCINGLNYSSNINHLFICRGHESAFGIKELVPSKKLFLEANKICKRVETEEGKARNVIEVINMSFFVNKGAYKIAEDNMYCLSQNRTYIRYIGNNIQRKRTGATYAEYEVNGIPVLCFDLKKDFVNGLIFPILDRGLLTFYLE